MDKYYMVGCCMDKWCMDSCCMELCHWTPLGGESRVELELGLSLAKFPLTTTRKDTTFLVESDKNLTLRYNPKGYLPWCVWTKQKKTTLS